MAAGKRGTITSFPRFLCRSLSRPRYLSISAAAKRSNSWQESCLFLVAVGFLGRRACDRAVSRFRNVFTKHTIRSAKRNRDGGGDDGARAGIMDDVEECEEIRLRAGECEVSKHKGAWECAGGEAIVTTQQKWNLGWDRQKVMELSCVFQWGRSWAMYKTFAILDNLT